MTTAWKRWIAAAFVAIVAAGGSWGAFRAAKADATPPRFAASMPRGALVYLEARDLSGLMKAWMGSPTRERYFKSASYKSFTRSRLYLKLQDRLGELNRGFGVDVSDERLAELAGGPSAIAIYDPGKLDVLIVTEVTSERATASTLFAQVKSFESRTTAKGAPYYAREVVSEHTSATSRIAFGYADGKLWIGTNETTVAEAIDGPQNGGLGGAVTETIKSAGDFAPHDLVMWIDLERATRNKYFDLYWVQRNGKDLQNLASGLVDLEFAPDGVHERRWFVAKQGVPTTAAADTPAALAALRSLAPAEAQLVDARSADERVVPTVVAALFGPERKQDTPSVVYASRGDDPFGEVQSDSSAESSRYRYLDSRFDADVDDPALASPVPASNVTKPAAPTPPAFADKVATLVAAAAPIRYATFTSLRLPDGQLFATDDRTVVLELGAPDRFAASEFEALVGDEFVRRFVVGGNTTKVAWTDVAGARSLAGALVSQGGAYRLVGRYLVIANEASSCAAVAANVAAASSGAAIEAPAGTLIKYAEVRVDAARGPFVRLVGVLDAGARASIEEDVSTDGEDSDNRPVQFFGENLVSLLDVVRELQTVRIATAVDGTVIRERVDYVWMPPATPAKPSSTPAAKPAAPKG